MPIIKDKYEGKGSQTRSKFLTRKENKAMSAQAPSGLSEQQKREIAKNSYRANPENSAQISNISSNINPVGLNIVNNLIIDSTKTNILIPLVSILKGGSLNSLIINNFNGSSAAATMGVHWSYGDQSRLTPTISSGVVTASKGAELNCIFQGSVPYLAGVDLSQITNTAFKDVSKAIYFYITSSQAGPTITFSTSSV